MTQPTEYEQVTYNSTTGAQAGRLLTDKIGFYGVTPVAQPTAATQTTLTATWVTLCATAGFGFRTSDQIISVIAAIKQIQTVMTTLGLWKGS